MSVIDEILLFLENIRIRIREISLQHIRSILNDVIKLQEDHPGTVISIKTHHTLNLLYNTVKRGINQIRSRGILDVDDCDLLEQSLKKYAYSSSYSIDYATCFTYDCYSSITMAFFK